MATAPNLSSNARFDMSVAEILMSAMQLAGLLTTGQAPSPIDYEMGRVFLSTFLKSLQADGTVLRTVERTTLALTAGTAEYSLAADTIGVEFPLTIVPATGIGETQVSEISGGEYVALADKVSQGRPSRAFVEKLATVRILLHPTPDSGSPTLRYRRVRLLKDVDNTSQTVDLPSRWLDTIVFSMAHRMALAKSKPLELVGYLNNQALAAKKQAAGSDGPSGTPRFVIGHSGRRV